MLFGKYNSRLDTKNRVFVPSVFAREFKSEILFLTSLKNFILVSTEDAFNEVVKSFLSMKKYQIRETLLRKINLSTFSCGMDKQRRILLPSPVVSEQKLKREVSWIGMKNYAEIWDKELFEQWNKDCDETYGNEMDDFVKSFKSLR